MINLSWQIYISAIFLLQKNFKSQNTLLSTLLDHISIEISLSINGSNLAQRYISATNDAFICEILLCIFRV